MIKDKLTGSVFVPPMDTETDALKNKRHIRDVLKGIVKLIAKVDKIQEDFDLIKKYTE
jgi:hypothetical protein